MSLRSLSVANLAIYCLFIPAMASAHLPAPHFATRKIVLGKHTISVEIADTPRKWEYGLMFRKSMPQNHGMLFIMGRAEILNFWMKNTLIPLSIGFFDRDKRLINIDRMPVTHAKRDIDFPHYVSRAPALYALEMNIGWFKRNKVKVCRAIHRKCKVWRFHFLGK